jgi:hypothetical protein
MTHPADDALAEVRRLNKETKKLLKEVADNQQKITDQLDRLDRAILATQSRGRHHG